MNIVIKIIDQDGILKYLQGYDGSTFEAVWTEHRKLALIIELTDEIQMSLPGYYGEDIADLIGDILMLRVANEIIIEEY